MYSLYEIYEKVFDEEASKYRWWYYHKLDKSRFNYSLKDIFNEKGEYYNRANDLIHTIYYAGEKDCFFEGLREELGERSRHMVSAFFLGHYLVHSITAFQELLNDTVFSWLWFLCCLYHDSYFKNEKSPAHPYYVPSYYWDSKNLLYSKTIIEKYRDYRLFNRCYDHGIYAASALSHHYRTLYNKRKNEKDVNHYDEGKLRITDETLKAINCVAKVIASHNIFIAQSENEKDNYIIAGLDKLIPSESNNCKMPKRKGKYELLYLLLSLVDVLEPIKRNISLEQVELEINNESTVHIRLNSGGNLSDCCRYIYNIIFAETWLNYLRINYEKRKDQIDIELCLGA